jgi:micrococcal nuclease
VGRRNNALLLAVTLVVSACAVDDAARPERSPHRDRDRATTQPSQTPEPAQTPKPGQGVRGQAKGPVSGGWKVTRVVDGDTVDVTRGGRTLTVRLIGIDTPETVHPTEPIECHGPEATLFATRRLLDEPVALEFDRSQGRRDYYDRVLAYVWTTRGHAAMFNREAVRRGHALEYTYDDPYAWQREFLSAQTAARGQRLGVWRCPEPGS